MFLSNIDLYEFSWNGTFLELSLQVNFGEP